MERIFSHKLKGFFVCLSLALIGMLLVNSSLYTHSHIDEYGQVIYHAHPFASSKEIPLPLKDTHHSNSYLYILSGILTLFIVSVVAIEFNDVSVNLVNRITNDTISFISCVELSKQRGPPHFNYEVV